jgi:MFS family permease
MPQAAADPAGPGGVPARVLVALVAGQLGLHAAMAGLRMAAPLQALREGYSPWSVGLLLALFAAAPVLLALYSGRLADRYGYHRPVYLAVALALVAMALAVLSTWFDGAPHFALLCAAAALSGSSANMGNLTLQRTAGLAARDPVERVRLFSWLGVAPSFSNVIGPVAVGFMIDAAGFRAGYLLLLLLPLPTLLVARWVPRQAPAPGRPPGTEAPAWSLLRLPGLKRLLVVNWLLSSCWDVHTFAVPVLGHERGFSASTIGLILGSFTLAVTVVRLVIPVVAHRLREPPVIRAAMLGSALALVSYPLAPNAWAMGGLAALLGVSLGCVQPMIMSMLHRLTPEGRHGQSLALRSMALNTSSTLMPLVFGATGTLAGAGLLFAVAGAAVGSGSWLTRRLRSGG